MGRGVSGLQDGILDEGQTGFLGIGDAEFALRDDGNPRAGEQLIDLPDLARVTAGEHDGFARV